MLNFIAIALATLALYLLVPPFSQAQPSVFEFAQYVLPTTGITIGLYLLFGKAVLVGAVLGSAFICYLYALPSTLVAAYSLVVLVQLVLARYICSHQFIKNIKPESSKRLFFLSVLTGPLVGLAGATIAVLSQYSELTVLSNTGESNNEAFRLWVSWWARDTLSIMFFMPLILILKDNLYLPMSQAPWRQISVAVFIYGLTVAIFSFSEGKAQTEKEQIFYKITQDYTQKILVAQNTIISYLKAMEGFFLASDNVHREEFRIFTESLKRNDIKLRALAWMPYVKHEDRKRFKENAIADGINEFAFRTVTKDGVVVSPNRNTYLPIYFTEPLETNRKALGIDISNHPIVTATVNRAIEKRESTISPLFSLAQQRDKATGIIAYYPVYKKPKPNHPETLLGVLEVVFELDVFLSAISREQDQLNYTLTFSYGEGNTLNIGEQNTDALFTYGTDIAFFDQSAHIAFFSTPHYAKESMSWVGWLAHLFGIFAGILVNAFFHTVTNFNRYLAKEITRKTAQLRQTNDELEAANKAQSTFLANMSHEIRTPLNGIMGVFQLFEKHTLSPEQKKLVDSGKASSSILLTILNDILDFSKIEAGKLEIESVPTDISALIESSIAEFKPLTIEKGLTLEFKYNRLDHHLWMTDPVRMKQILNNLLSNAVKFTEKGYIKTELECHDTGIIFTVGDSGIGMSEQAMNSLFDRFEQADKSTTRKYGGTGLGMAITKQIIDLMGGAINVSSQVGSGTEFKISLPFIAADVEEHSAADQINAPVLSDKKILIAEDNLINQEIILSIMEETQANLLIANNGEEAVMLFKEHHPDIVFMDIQMPVLDGVDACKAIREIDSNTPIISVSANTYEEDIKTYFSSGFNAHIPKPVDFELVYQTLNRFVVN